MDGADIRKRLSVTDNRIRSFNSGHRPSPQISLGTTRRIDDEVRDSRDIKVICSERLLACQPRMEHLRPSYAARSLDIKRTVPQSVHRRTTCRFFRNRILAKRPSVLFKIVPSKHFHPANIPTFPNVALPNFVQRELILRFVLTSKDHVRFMDRFFPIVVSLFPLSSFVT